MEESKWSKGRGISLDVSCDDMAIGAILREMLGQGADEWVDRQRQWMAEEAIEVAAAKEAGGCSGEAGGIRV